MGVCGSLYIINNDIKITKPKLSSCGTSLIQVAVNILDTGAIEWKV